MAIVGGLPLTVVLCFAFKIFGKGKTDAPRISLAINRGFAHPPVSSYRTVYAV